MTTKTSSRATLFRHFYQFLDKPPELKPLKQKHEVYLKIDGTYFKRWGCALVYKADRKVIFTDFTVRENYLTYLLNLIKIIELGYVIKGVTSDGCGSLESALKTLFPDIPHQRCLVHLQRFCQTLLTKKPETNTGVELLEIVKQLNCVKNYYEKNIWLKWFKRFEERNKETLNQRTYQNNEGKTTWWYTHKNPRRAYRTIKNSLPNLFLYLDYQNLPKDTNGLEGEFSHLKRKLSLHRGLKRKRKINFVKWYFLLKEKAENY
ncbi:transposase [Candidatus Gottesmanbacteria bacterium]|nr:transposase [Candidatus Gottesmanbacteria bacterium]